MQSRPAGDSGGLTAPPWERLDGLSGWGEVVLPPATLDQLRALPAQFEARFWTSSGGLGSPAVEGRRGLLLLVGGPRGSGKTLTARALAGALHLSVLQADLEVMFARGRADATQLVARLFATAQRLGAVVALDRADDVLRAASVGGAPRIAGMAAIDVRDLLRRSEAHPGVVIFNTTVAGELGQEVLARFDRVVELPFPDATARTEIWRRALPADAQVRAHEIDALAQGFALSGKQIADCSGQADRLALRAGRGVQLGDVASALEQSPEMMAAARLGALGDLRRLTGEPQSPVEPVARPPEPAPEPEPQAEPEPKPEPSPEPEVVPEHEPEAGPEPEPEPEPAPPAERASPRPLAPPAPAGPRFTRRGLVTVALLGALGAVVLGLSAGEHGSHSRTTTVTTSQTVTLTRTATVGPVRFTYPSSWTEQAAPTLSPGPGLTFTRATAVASSSPPIGRLTVGTTASRATDTPLPTRFIAAQRFGTPVSELVKLGPNHFYRVIDPHLALGAKSQSVYAMASGTGAVVALCQTSSRAFAAQCERVLATLTAPPPRVTLPKPSPAKVAYARALNTIIAKLNAARSLGARRLAAARVALTQADALRSLALAHADAATAVAALTGGPSTASAALVSALQRLSLGYRTLGDAAAVVAPVTFNADRKLVADANTALAAALARLRSLGYRVS